MRPSALVLLLSAGLIAADAPQAGNEQVEQVMKTFKGRGVMADDTPASKPVEALVSPPKLMPMRWKNSTSVPAA